ncbi:MAG: hypothetical protein LBR19_08325 [Bifidobacteriaceae bacterium]|jgi:hypothetical protein|nr:hypothetical protein [Bifidobacteriaceae bacterium]
MAALAKLIEPYSSLDEPEATYAVVMGVDYTTELRQCVASSGFTLGPLMPTEVTAEEELAQKQEVAAAGVRWATCARDAGFDGVQDPAPPVADGFESTPTALIPASITEASLRALLAACPPVSEARFLVEEAADGPLYYEPAPQPAIGFDLPGFDGTDASVPSSKADLAETLYGYLDIIGEAYQEAWENLPEVVGE